jgi:hypothetical protein
MRKEDENAQPLQTTESVNKPKFITFYISGFSGSFEDKKKNQTKVIRLRKP